MAADLMVWIASVTVCHTAAPAAGSIEDKEKEKAQNEAWGGLENLSLDAKLVFHSSAF